MYYVPIRAAIKVILDALVPTTLKVVFNGEQNKQGTQISAFPAVEIVRVDSRSDFFENRTDETDFNFEIRVYTQIQAETQHGAVEVLAETAIDAIYSALMASTHLGGLLENRIRPVVSGRGVLSWNGQNVRMDVIALACTKLVSLS